MSNMKSKFQYTEGSKITFEGKELAFASKSEMFKDMYKRGCTIGEISSITKCHYSFVYGVISANFEVQKVVGDSKSDKIRDLVKAGKTPGEIAKELNSNYSFVHSVVKKYKKELEAAASK